MARRILTDEHWPKLKRILLAESIDDKSDLRLTKERFGIDHSTLQPETAVNSAACHTASTSCDGKQP